MGGTIRKLEKRKIQIFSLPLSASGDIADNSWYCSVFNASWTDMAPGHQEYHRSYLSVLTFGWKRLADVANLRLPKIIH